MRKFGRRTRLCKLLAKSGRKDLAATSIFQITRGAANSAPDDSVRRALREGPSPLVWLRHLCAADSPLQTESGSHHRWCRELLTNRLASSPVELQNRHRPSAAIYVCDFAHRPRLSSRNIDQRTANQIGDIHAAFVELRTFGARYCNDEPRQLFRGRD